MRHWCLGDFIKAALIASLLLTSPTVAWADDKRCYSAGDWWLPAGERHTSTAQLVNELYRRPVILLGEQHDLADHHRWQLHTISALYGKRSDIALGFEMFPRRVQTVLDRWVAGELSESAFLKQVEWRSIWGYDPALYMPIFHFARINAIPMLALNINRDTARVAGDKGVHAMTASEREGVSLPVPATDDYLNLLAQTFSGHDHAEDATVENGDIKKDKRFQRFVDAQQLWDRAMAEGIAKAIDGDNPPLVIAIMGSGHIVERFGVPHQLADLGITDSAVLLPSVPDMPCAEISARSADAVFGLPQFAEADTPRKQRLGVHLNDDEGKIKITRIVDDSIAQRCGLEEGDTFVSIAERGVHSIDDVVEAVDAMQAGTWLPIRVMRGDTTLDLVAKFPNAPQQGDKEPH